MARGKATKKTKTEKKRDISAYTHEDKQRAYNPPVGLVTPDTDKDSDKKTYAYDPHLDPQLVWAWQGGTHLFRRADRLSSCS